MGKYFYSERFCNQEDGHWFLRLEEIDIIWWREDAITFCVQARFEQIGLCSALKSVQVESEKWLLRASSNFKQLTNKCLNPDIYFQSWDYRYLPHQSDKH